MRRTLAQVVSIACVLTLFAFETETTGLRVAQSHHLVANAGPNVLLATTTSPDVPDALLRTGVLLLAAPAVVGTFVFVAQSSGPARLQEPTDHERAPPLT
ncbi:MAG TPA: hypothetical protein VMT28_03310 [Terriglobales bacterium]|jgi:hypothetical protein|nr:hypothetical protein [Terriglobales bacterium]